MDDELDRAVPAGKGINQRISSLIPVASRAESTARGADLGQRVMHRVGAHTGALVGAAAGGALGHRYGGTPGAAVGTGVGLLAPEILASPSVQMLGTRSLQSGAPTKLARAVGSQLLKRQQDQDTE